MTENPGFLIYILGFIVVIGPLVFLHELGHYLAGRWFGVKAEEFSVGFGPEIGGVTDRRGTRWKFCALPLGGYVRFAGDMNPASQPDPAWMTLPAAEREQTFQAKSLWQRAVIVAAGPLTNFLIAILILAGFALAYGEPRTTSVVGVVAEGSPAATAGLRPGDRITSIGGRSVSDFTDLANYTRMRPGERVVIELERDGRPATAEALIGTHLERDRFGNEYRLGRLGIGPATVEREAVGILEAPLVGIRMTGSILDSMLTGIGQIISGRRSVDELGGPLRMAQFSGEQLSLGLIPALLFAAGASISLGFINLLPVPVLDGGHLMFYAIEAVRRRPVEPHVAEWAYRGGLIAILGLMLLVTFNDLGAFGLWRGLAGLIG